jgi:hypothetical protein
MPDFKTRTPIIIQSQDEVPYKFTFTVCSSATLNDGALPYNTTISSAEVKAHSEAGTDLLTELISNSTLNGLVITVKLRYPATSGIGVYHLTFKLTLSDFSVVKFAFNRVMAMDK